MTRKLSLAGQYKLILVLVAGSLTSMAGGVVAPVLPTVIQALDLDRALAGNLVSIHSLTIALFSLPLGMLADRVGASRVLVPSLVLYAVFGVAGAWMDSFWSLLATRALIGVACGGIAASSLGLIGQMYEGERRTQAIAYATSTLTLSGLFFPLLGGWAGSFNWRLTFFLYAIGLPLGIWAAALFASDRKVRKTARDRQSERREVLQKIFRDRRVWLVLATISMVSVSMYSVVAYAPLYLKQTLGVGSLLNGVILASRAVGAAAISAFGAKPLAKAFGRDKAIAIGFGLMFLTLASIPWLTHFFSIFLTAFLFGVGFGLILPNLYSCLAELAPNQVRSTVLASGAGVSFLGQFLSPVLLGPLLKMGDLPLVFYGAAAIALATGIAFLTQVNE